MGSYEVLPGVLTQQALAAGGGGGPPTPSATISMATNPSGNFNNALKCGFFQSNAHDYILPCSDLDGNATNIQQGDPDPVGVLVPPTMGYHVASSPTRTVQNFVIDHTEFEGHHLVHGAQASNVFAVGGYARGFISGVAANASVSNVVWGTAGASQIVASLASNGCTFTMTEMSAQNSRQNIQDNTDMYDGAGIGLPPGSVGVSQQGIYGSPANGSGTGIFILKLTYGGGRGGLQYPNIGDFFRVRFTLDAQVAGVTATQITHEIGCLLF